MNDNIRALQKTLGTGSDGVIGNETLTKFQCKFGVKNKASVAHFFGNVHHESNGFTDSVEGLDYSADSLLKTFSKYFKTIDEAKKFARQPEKIANYVYGGRMGNVSVGDGWKYRGRGGIQLTGKINYIDFNKWLLKKGYIGADVVNNPSQVSSTYFWESAVYFFETRNLFNLVADISDNSIEKICKVINGGLNGILDREKKVKYYFSLFK